MPKRIQRKRTKGWRMPEGAVYVGRPSRWGNPFAVERWAPFREWAVTTPDQVWFTWTEADPHNDAETTCRRKAVELFELHIGPMGDYEYDDRALTDLRRDLAGRDLACWCPLDQPCHADVLLELANGGAA